MDAIVDADVIVDLDMIVDAIVDLDMIVDVNADVIADVSKGSNCSNSCRQICVLTSLPANTSIKMSIKH